MKILVVDDEEKFARALAERLTLRGFDATPVFDGTSALAQLPVESIDGMVLDLRLPDMDGIQVLQQIREKWSKITVVVLSGHATRQDFQRCLQMGAAACFHKPAKISEIAEALRDFKEKG